jgi:hypothetical protein
MSLSMSTAKNALITTAVTLAVIYALRQVTATKAIVNKALAG